MAAPLLSNVTLRTLCLENVVRDRCANASLKLVDVFPRFMVHALRVHDSSVQVAS